MPERWKDVVGFEGFYEVSNQGRVRSVDREDSRGRFWPAQILAPGAQPSGHLSVSLSRDGKRTMRKVHRLVLAAFVGPCPEGMEGLHSDDDPTNNTLPNLRWGTRGENLLDSVRNGRHSGSRKTHCPQHHPLEAPNLIASLARRGRRACLACSYEREHARYHHLTFSPERADARFADITRKASA